MEEEEFVIAGRQAALNQRVLNGLAVYGLVGEGGKAG